MKLECEGAGSVPAHLKLTSPAPSSRTGKRKHETVELGTLSSGSPPATGASGVCISHTRAAAC